MVQNKRYANGKTSERKRMVDGPVAIGEGGKEKKHGNGRDEEKLERREILMLYHLAQWRFNMLNSVAIIDDAAAGQRRSWGKIMKKLMRLYERNEDEYKRIVG